MPRRTGSGISQPYVVRMFGAKGNLFVDVLDRALGKLTQELIDYAFKSKINKVLAVVAWDAAGHE